MYNSYWFKQKECAYKMANIDELKQYKHIHLIGIGGVSMSGIAEILHYWGFIITGSGTTRFWDYRQIN